MVLERTGHSNEVTEAVQHLYDQGATTPHGEDIAALAAEIVEHQAGTQSESQTTQHPMVPETVAVESEANRAFEGVAGNAWRYGEPAARNLEAFRANPNEISGDQRRALVAELILYRDISSRYRSNRAGLAELDKFAFMSSQEHQNATASAIQKLGMNLISDRPEDEAKAGDFLVSIGLISDEMRQSGVAVAERNEAEAVICIRHTTLKISQINYCQSATLMCCDRKFGAAQLTAVATLQLLDQTARIDIVPQIKREAAELAFREAVEGETLNTHHLTEFQLSVESGADVALNMAAAHIPNVMDRVTKEYIDSLRVSDRGKMQSNRR